MGEKKPVHLYLINKVCNRKGEEEDERMRKEGKEKEKDMKIAKKKKISRKSQVLLADAINVDYYMSCLFSCLLHKNIRT